MSTYVSPTLPIKLGSVILLIIFALVNQYDAKFTMDDRFMSDVNLEHYYVIEENALSNADVLLREDYFGADEEEDMEEHEAHAPNLTMFKSIIDETKTVHRLAGPNMEDFLAHPVNIYHLFRRLDNGWREGIDLLLQTKPCKKWNLPSMVGRLRYLRDNLPGKQEVERVVQYISLLQKIHKLSAKEIAKGKIGDAVSLRPLDPEDMFDIARVMHDRDDMRTALDWLHQISDLLMRMSRPKTEGLSFTLTDILNMMASAYYHLRDVSKALNTTEKVLQIDPNNGMAQNNIVFFKNKLVSEKEATKKLPAPPELNSRYERLCARKKPAKTTAKKCRLARVGLTTYNMEQIRHKPHVVMFHDVVPNKTLEVLKNYAHEIQTERAWKTEETFRAPELNVLLDYAKLRRRTVKREMKRLLRHTEALAKAMKLTPDKWEKLQIFNVGLEGMHLQEHEKELNLVRYGPKHRRGEAGGFFVILNEVKKGGEVVMTENSIILTPKKGDVLFYYPTKTTSHSFCPVIGGSLWVAVQPMHEDRKKHCLEEDEWL